MECKRYILSNYDNLIGECDCYGTDDEPCWGAVHIDESQCFCEYCCSRIVCEGHDGDDYNKPLTNEEAKPYDN